MIKKRVKTAAAIDIGSSGVRMQISQWDGKKMSNLDRLEKSTGMGREVFTTGRISLETARELSAILAGFQAAAHEYDTTRIDAVATTALREASNRGYVLDYLAIQNKLNVRVLEDSEANALQFQAMETVCSPDDKRVLMVYGGTGTINYQLREDGQTVFAQSLRTGLIRIAEMLHAVSERTRHIDRVAEEYIGSLISQPYSMREISSVDSIVLSTGDMKKFFELCGADISKNRVVFSTKYIFEVFEDIRQMSIDQISNRYRVSQLQSGQLYATLVLLKYLAGLGGNSKVHCVHTSLVDALVVLNLQSGAKREFNEKQRSGALESARYLAARYGCDAAHGNKVVDIAMLLFGKLYRIHGLPKKQSFMLQIACILHEAGDFIHTSVAKEAGYDLIRTTQIYGMNAYDMLLVANIVEPRGLSETLRGSHAAPDESDVLFVSKMHAILQLADAFDYAKEDKVKSINVELNGNEFNISINSRDDFTLEEWIFSQRRDLFQEAFGLSVNLELGNKFEIKED